MSTYTYMDTCFFSSEPGHCQKSVCLFVCRDANIVNAIESQVCDCTIYMYSVYRELFDCSGLQDTPCIVIQLVLQHLIQYCTNYPCTCSIYVQSPLGPLKCLIIGFISGTDLFTMCLYRQDQVGFKMSGMRSFTVYVFKDSNP